jgi:hypothetical protein
MQQSKLHPDPTLPLRYLRMLWPTAPSGFLLVWVKKGKRSLWFTGADPESAATAAVQHAARSDVYLQSALSPADFGPHIRCAAAQTVAIPGQWADIDIAGPAHKKAGPPPNIEAAMALAHAMPLPPSLPVHSGHGIQP